MRRTFAAATVAATALGLGAAIPSIAKPPKPGTSQLKAAAHPAIVTFGQATTVSGKRSGPGHAGAPVSLAQDPFPYGDGFLPLAQATTAGSGSFAFSLRPQSNRNYRVTSGQLVAFTGVRVRARVILSVSDATPRRGQFVRFFGSVRPRHDGKLVLIQRQSTTGRWSTVRRTLLRHAATGNRSTFSTRMRVFRSAGYRARFPADGDHLTGTSATRTLTVH